MSREGSYPSKRCPIPPVEQKLCLMEPIRLTNSLEPTRWWLRITDSSSRNAVNNSSACTTKRFPSSRCASAIQIVRPLESIADKNRADSRLLFLAEFLESRIGAQRVPGRIEPKKGGRDGEPPLSGHHCQRATNRTLSFSLTQRARILR
jgi:hypothetical protein